MKSKYVLGLMQKVELVTYAKKNGIIFSTDMKKIPMIDKILAHQDPEASHQGILKYARKIKYGADVGTGGTGVVSFLRTIYPSLDKEEARIRARAIQLTVGGV